MDNSIETEIVWGRRFAWCGFRNVGVGARFRYCHGDWDVRRNRCREDYAVALIVCMYEYYAMYNCSDCLVLAHCGTHQGLILYVSRRDFEMKALMSSLKLETERCVRD
jgi:hypothetical protein